eukprot:scaffold4385_cov24-Tisochrysis_lutea.AAC.1
MPSTAGSASTASIRFGGGVAGPEGVVRQAQEEWGRARTRACHRPPPPAVRRGAGRRPERGTAGNPLAPSALSLSLARFIVFINTSYFERLREE